MPLISSQIFKVIHFLQKKIDQYRTELATLKTTCTAKDISIQKLQSQVSVYLAWFDFGVLCHFQQYFSYIVAVLITLTGAVVMILWKLNLQLHITTNIVSSNPAQAKCTRYNIHVIKYVSDLGAGWWFSPSTTDSPL
jgi:hypothetical protein